MAESKGIENALAAMLAKMETMSEEIKASKMSLRELAEEMKKSNIFKSVSYTHLDVYKRQV